MIMDQFMDCIFMVWNWNFCNDVMDGRGQKLWEQVIVLIGFDGEWVGYMSLRYGIVVVFFCFCVLSLWFMWIVFLGELIFVLEFVYMVL